MEWKSVKGQKKSAVPKQDVEESQAESDESGVRETQAAAVVEKQ